MAGFRALPLSAALLLAACGGGTALMHPAHTLPKGRFSAGAGVSNHFVFGEPKDRIDRARAAARAESTSNGASADLEAGALALALTGPGLAPWLGARAGLGSNVEVGATYTGRAGRFDGRYAFQNEMFALSVGGGLSAVTERPERSGMLASSGSEGIDALKVGRTRGWGGDLPVLIGFRTDISLVQAWLGARAGFERLSGEIVYQLASSSEQWVDLDGARWYTGGLFGLSVGVHPIWVVIEVDAMYQHLSGEWQRREPGAGTDSARWSGATITPTGALVGQF